MSAPSRDAGTASNGAGAAGPAGAYSFEALPGGIVRLTMNTRVMHLDQARPLCGDIEEASSGTGGDAISIVVDVGRVGLATPAAAFHGLMTLRHVRIDSIALVHASPAMRRMATLMLRAARFRRFGFFDDEQAAVAWLQDEPEGTPGTPGTPGGQRQASPPAAPTPSGRQRAAARLAAGVTVAALSGGLVAIRRRNGRRRKGRVPRGAHGDPSRRPRVRRAAHER